MKRVIVVFVVLVVGLGAGLWIKVRQTRAAAQGAPGSSGVIEGKEVDVASRLPARIAKVLVREGERVKAGQVLVELDCREQRALLSAAQAALKGAQGQAAAAQSQVAAALGSARAAVAGIHATGAQQKALQATRAATSRQVKRISQLKGEGGATEADLDRASTQAEQLGEQLSALRAKAQVARSQAAAARARAEAIRRQAEAALSGIQGARANLERAQAVVDECTLRAPVAGVVLTRAYEPGEVVLPGSRVLTVVRLDPVETVFYVPNRHLAGAAAGRPVQVSADAYPERTFRGKVLSVAAEAEFTPRNIQTREDRDRLVYAVRAEIPNKDRALRPGMPVEVRITQGNGR
jgi:HlyD family secretion protein